LKEFIEEKIEEERGQTRFLTSKREPEPYSHGCQKGIKNAREERITNPDVDLNDYDWNRGDSPDRVLPFIRIA
jgi:hypothetical protein